MIPKVADDRMSERDHPERYRLAWCGKAMPCDSPWKVTLSTSWGRDLWDAWFDNREDAVAYAESRGAIEEGN